MANNWTSGKLSDIAEIIMGQSPPGEACSSDSQGTPLLNGPTEFGSRHPEPRQFTTDIRKAAKKGDILFCVRGSTTGRMNYADQEYAIGRGLAALRHNSGYKYQPFLKAILDYHLPQLLGSSTGSTFPNISQEQLKNLAIQIPPLETQKEIAHILGTLDNKIELNRKMNKTLEEIAQSLYKYWFIDFEFPNTDCKPYKSSGGEMIDSELGLIPKGWKVGRLSEEFDITMGQSPPGDTYNLIGDGLPFYQGNADFSFRYPKDRVYCTLPKRLAEDGDTLISVRAPVGDMNMAYTSCCIGRGLCAIRHRLKANSYTYYSMYTLAKVFDAFNGEGTVFGSLNKDDFYSLKWVSSSSDVLMAFESSVSSMDSSIKSNSNNTEQIELLKHLLVSNLLVINDDGRLS